MALQHQEVTITSSYMNLSLGVSICAIGHMITILGIHVSMYTSSYMYKYILVRQ